MDHQEKKTTKKTSSLAPQGLLSFDIFSILPKFLFVKFIRPNLHLHASAADIMCE